MPDSDEKYQQVIVRMPRWLHDAIKLQAEAEERSMATCIRRAVREYLRDPVVEQGEL